MNCICCSFWLLCCLLVVTFVGVFLPFEILVIFFVTVINTPKHQGRSKRVDNVQGPRESRGSPTKMNPQNTIGLAAPRCSLSIGPEGLATSVLKTIFRTLNLFYIAGSVIIERIEEDFPNNRHERSLDEDMPLALHMRLNDQGEETLLRLRRVPTLKSRSLTESGIVEHDISSIRVRNVT